MILHGDMPVHGRRHSVDTGGLAIALDGTGNHGLGHGWGSYQDTKLGGIQYAELLSDMYYHTKNAASYQCEPSQPLDIAPRIRKGLIKLLDDWNFDPHTLSDEDVLACTIILFETLYRIVDMPETIGIPLLQIKVFLVKLSHSYRENHYHNFRHALDVLQATSRYLAKAGMVPRPGILLGSPGQRWKPQSRERGALLSSLDNDDLFTIYLAAIGHDVGHPGFTNNFMKNARAPLSLVYDDKSALENLHYALLTRIMRHNGLGDLLDRPQSGHRRRQLLLWTLLATDMSVHFDFMKKLENFAGEHDLLSQKALACQALIKCADISNPSRPHKISREWAVSLSDEWSTQASMEQHLQLPNTVAPSGSDALAQAKGQVGFIKMFCKPLLDLTAKAIPDMALFATRCTSNLETWETKLNMISNPPMVFGSKSPAPASGCQPKRRQNSGSTTSSMVSGQPFNEYLSAFPMTWPNQSPSHPESDVSLIDSVASSPRTHASSGSSLNGGAPSDRPISSFDLPDSLSSISLDNHHLSHPQPHRPHLQWQPSSVFVIPTIVSPNSTTSSSLSSASLRSPGIGDDVLSSLGSSIPRPSSAASGISIASSAANTIASTSTTAVPADATAAMRAAYEKGPRKKSSVKSFHRNSWNPPLGMVPPVPLLPDRVGSERVGRVPEILTTQMSL